jgi:hypothetical protein
MINHVAIYASFKSPITGQNGQIRTMDLHWAGAKTYYLQDHCAKSTTIMHVHMTTLQIHT